MTLTAAFVAGLVAVTVTLFLAVLAARNDAVYHDIALYAAAQGDLAARVITDAEKAEGNVMATKDTAMIALLSPNVVNRLQALPGYIVVVDTMGRAVYRSTDVMRLEGSDMATLQTQLKSLPSSGEALISPDSLQEKVLFVSHRWLGTVRPQLDCVRRGCDLSQYDSTRVPARCAHHSAPIIGAAESALS